MMPPWASMQGLARTPTVHRCPQGKAVGGPQHDSQCDKRATKKTGTTVLNNVRDSGAVLSPVSSASIQQRTERRRVGQEVDGQLAGSRKQQRQRTQGNTPGRRTRFKSEEFIDKVENEIAHLVEDEQCPAQNPHNKSSTQWR